MGFSTAVRICILQKFLAFQGRASRSEYWWFVLAFVIGSLITQIIWYPIYLVYSVVLMIPLLAVGFRRLQDTGRPGQYILYFFGLSALVNLIAPRFEGLTTGPSPALGPVILVVLIGTVQMIALLVFLWWLSRPSQPETNPYGPMPVPQP